MSRKIFLYSAVPVIFAAGLWAQSRLSIDQLRRGSQSPDQLIAIDIRGQFYALKLGPGLRIEGGEIRVETPAVTSPQRLTPDAAGTFPLAPRISRNGLVQTPGVDYSVENGRIAPLSDWESNDVVAAF